MFRGKTKSKMQPDQFGVGSIIKAADDYLVVGFVKSVKVLNLVTMELSHDLVDVEDINFISENEARKICTLVNPNWAFTDFEIDAKGLKCS